MIDLHTLDNFAKDHLQYEANCTRCFQNPSFSTPPTDAEVLCGLDRIRNLIMGGFIDEALETCEKICSHPIEDPRVQLNVRIHKLFELLHAAENMPKEKMTLYNQAMQEALGYSQQLADYALNAFPEAYSLFTESMMLFAYPDQTSTAEAIQKRRAKLAEELVSLTRMTVRARESCLSFLVRYLILIYLQFKSPVIIPGETLDPLHELIQELLDYHQTSLERTSRIAWKIDGSRATKFSGRADYKEADIQTLPERVNISRQESIESLRFADGDVFNALKNELGMVFVNRQRFRVMIVEYCAARGLEVFEIAKSPETTNTSAQYLPLCEDSGKLIIPDNLLAPLTLERFAGMCKLRKLAENGDFDSFLDALRQVDSMLLESTPVLDFQIGQGQVLQYIQKGEFSAAVDLLQRKLGPLAKRYPEFLPLLTDIVTLVIFASDLQNIQGASRPKSVAPSTEAETPAEKDARPRRSRAGDKRIRHTRLSGNAVSGSGVKSGGEDGQSMSFEEFLADAFWSVKENASLDSIVSGVYSAYERKFEEPQLIQLLKRLLPAHEEWQTQNMMTDQFSMVLGIDEIRGKVAEGSRSVLDKGEGKSGDDKAASAESGTQGQGGSNVGSDRSRRDQQRENTILTLMEFLAMSRAEAIAVVRNHPHAENPQSILDSVLGTML